MAGGEDVMVGKGTVRFKLGYREAISDQGVSISVYADVAGEEAELLRFDCFEHQPHYHYGPEKKDERLYPTFPISTLLGVPYSATELLDVAE